MLIGEYTQKIGEKFRIAFPKAFRDVVGTSFIITKGYENCLIIISKDNWESMINENVVGPFTLGLVRDTSRFLLGSATKIDLDKQGRFVVPITLRKYANLNKTGVFLGLGKWIELWDEDLWDKKRSEIEKNSSIVGDKLASIKLND